jgi:hypothetical protein
VTQDLTAQLRGSEELSHYALPSLMDSFLKRNNIEGMKREERGMEKRREGGGERRAGRREVRLNRRYPRVSPSSSTAATSSPTMPSPL